MTVEPVQLTILLLLGLAVGSFLNVCIHRIPRGQSLVYPSSRCPGCGYELRWFDNIPVVSYVSLLGRCRKCRARISLRYPLVEVATMALFAMHGLSFGWTALLVPRLLFACILVVLFAIDLEHHLLPNVITHPGLLFALGARIAVPNLLGMRPEALGGAWTLGLASSPESPRSGLTR